MGPKVLIVDDEADVIKYLTVVLKSNGFLPYAVNSVKEANAEVGKIKPDLICLDIMMPEETGLSFYARLKRDKKFRDIPVIIISGVVQSGEFDFRKHLSDNFVPPPEHFMEKPINVEKFLETITQLISSKRSSGKGRSA